MSNEIIKLDTKPTLELCESFGFNVYTVEQYRDLVNSKSKKDVDYSVDINKMFKPIWRKSELVTVTDKPEHCIGFVYGMFSEFNLFDTPKQVMNKLIVSNLFYIGYGISPKRPLEHLVYGDSIYKYTKSVKENTKDNIYIVILACRLNELDAKDGEAIFQNIFSFEQLPGNKFGEEKGVLKNKKIQKPKSITLFDKKEGVGENERSLFSEYKHLF